MAHREYILNRQRGIPAEEGFDIREAIDVGGSGPSAAGIDTDPNNVSMEDSVINSSKLLSLALYRQLPRYVISVTSTSILILSASPLSHALRYIVFYLRRCYFAEGSCANR